jgi:DNA-binding NarL/FixJ family response regulator
MGLRVLVVDDHPLVAEALTLAVQQGHPTVEIETAADLAGACDKAADGSYDLVFLDLMLPDSEGLSGLLALRECAPATRVAIVTSRANADSVRSAADFGAVGYVLKSLPFTELTEACRELVAGGAHFPTIRSEPAMWDDDAVRDRLASLSAAQAASSSLSRAAVRTSRSRTTSSSRKRPSKRT